jgi:predicted nucleic acid-binding protein
VPYPRGVFDLSIAPPETVALDTSAILRALLEDQSSHAEYADFLQRAVRAGTTLAYGELVDLELAQTCIKAARAACDGDRARAVPRGRQLIAEVFQRWRELMSQTSSVRVPLGLSHQPDVLGSPVRDTAFHLIEHYGLDSYDATHAATAMIAGAPLVCADRGFAHVPEQLLVLITDDEGAWECRRLRTAASQAEPGTR